MKKLLIEYNSNWADEMDISGFSVMTADRWEKKKEKLMESGSFEYGVGTNEEIEYNSGEEALEDYTVKEITEAEYETLLNLGLKSFGFIGPIGYL